MINLRRTLLPGTMLLAVQAFALPALGQQCDHDSTPITASPGPGGQSVVTDQSVVADPNLAAGPEGRGSKLATLDSVVIDAPVALSLPGNPAGTSVCYSISNSTPQSYFVPWNTPSEWSAFLQAIGASHQLSALLDTAPPPANASWINGISVSLCCPEQQVGTICQAEGGPLVSTSELGYRYKGTPSGDIPSWAAEGDVYGPVYAADVAGNPNLNYRVTFVCQNGAWVKTHEEGSCVPTPGQCAPGSAGLTALPSDLTTLCAAGSIFGGLTNTGGAGPWTWTCLGTPGQADASCSSAASGCGPANATVDMSPAAPAAGTLCAGTSTLAASPVLTTGAPPAWTWTCKDNSSGLSASCSAISDASPPACGSAAGGMYAIAPSDPAALCQSGTPSNVIIYNWFGSVLWGWQCTDFVGGGTVCTASVLNSGQCGSANGVHHPQSPSTYALPATRLLPCWTSTIHGPGNAQELTRVRSMPLARHPPISWPRTRTSAARPTEHYRRLRRQLIYARAALLRQAWLIVATANGLGHVSAAALHPFARPQIRPKRQRQHRASAAVPTAPLFQTCPTSISVRRAPLAL